MSSGTPDAPSANTWHYGAALWSGLRAAEKIGLLGMIAFTIIALFPYQLAPFDPQTRVAPAFLSPSFTHFFGTDEIGRDLFSRVLLGIRYTWLPGLGIIFFGLLFGSLIGMVAGAVGGLIDSVIEKFINLVLVLPSTLVALAVTASLGAGLTNMMIAIGICWWPWYAVIARAEVRRIRARPHMIAARLAGTTRIALFWRHVLPGTTPSLLVAAALDVANVVTTLSLMSFLGLGLPEPNPELGSLSARSLENLTVFWWLPILPAVAILVLCLSANLFADSLRSSLRGR